MAFGGEGAREPREIEEVLSVRKEDRQPVGVVAPFPVELRDRLRLASVLRDDVERPAGRGREDDDARRAPGSALRKIGDRTEDRRRSARSFDSLELLIGSESEKAAVRRPERELRVFRPRERLRVGGIQGPYEQSHLPVGSAGREGELPSVRGEDRRTRLRRVDDEDRTFGRIDRRAVDALLGGASAQRERPRSGRERGRNRPGEIERPFAPSLTTRSFHACYSGARHRGFFFEG